MHHNALFHPFPEKQILVLGDLMIDYYIKGPSHRLSPEAPVPIIDIEEKRAMLGGAGNTVCNLVALGATVSVCAAAGDDASGAVVDQLLKKAGCKNSPVLTSGRQTISKTRVLAGEQALARLDEGCTTDINDATENQLIGILDNLWPTLDALVISDYNKGTITERIINHLQHKLSASRIFLAIDSKQLQRFARLKPDFVKPNYEEYRSLVGAARTQNRKTEQVLPDGDKLYEMTGANLIAVTLDTEGAVIFERGQVAHYNAAPLIANPKVAGAGDTYFSTFTLASISNLSITDAATMASAAATIAVQKPDTARCSFTELQSYFVSGAKEVNDLSALRLLVERYKGLNKRIVFTNGCFDILHSGHVTYLHCAKELGDILIVGINNDESIRRIKGPQRPINTLEERMKVLAGLASVDHVVSFGSTDDDTPISLVKIIQPDVFAKGGDYNRSTLPEADTVEAHGGRIVLLPHIPERSTTGIIDRIKHSRKLESALSE